MTGTLVTAFRCLEKTRLEREVAIKAFSPDIAKYSRAISHIKLSGKIGLKHWSAVGTYRDDKLRIISGRRSTIEARRLGITRQSLVKMWIAEKFKADNQVSE